MTKREQLALKKIYENQVNEDAYNLKGYLSNSTNTYITEVVCINVVVG